MRDRGRPAAIRVLLVGLTRLMMRTLEGPLSDRAEVSAAPFPSEAFERLADELRPHLVVVDVTYLREELVRPRFMDRFAKSGSVLVFTSESGGGWVDDLRTQRSSPLESHAPDALLALVRPPALTLVPR